MLLFTFSVSLEERKKKNSLHLWYDKLFLFYYYCEVMRCAFVRSFYFICFCFPKVFPTDTKGGGK